MRKRQENGKIVKNNINFSLKWKEFQEKKNVKYKGKCKKFQEKYKK